MKLRPALTLIELMIVIGLVAILTGFGIVSFSAVRDKQALYASADTLKNVFTMAHIYARESRDESRWGVIYVDNRTFSLVKGDIASPTVLAEYKLNSPIVFGNGSFNNWFDMTTGWPHVPYKNQIHLKDSRGNLIKVTINQSGVIEVEN